jgi:putative ABC transport system permease protein
MHARPPRFAETLLRWILPPDVAEAVAGDLEEMMSSATRPRWWYSRQVMSIAASRALLALRSSAPMDVKGGVMAFRQDLAYALRSLKKSPVFAMTSIAMLALGIGANVAIFSLLNAVLLKPLPFADPDRLMSVHLLAPDREAGGLLRPMIWSYPKYLMFREAQRVFEETAVFGGGNWNLTGTSMPDRVQGEFVESTYFGVLGVQTYLGRAFAAAETAAPGSSPLVVLSHRFWSQRFSADPSIVGRVVGLNGIAHTVIGVLPAGFSGLTGQADIWVPITTLSAADLGETFDHSYNVVAKRRVDITAQQADVAVRAIGTAISTRAGDRGGRWSAGAVSLDDRRIDPIVRRSIVLMLAVVGSVLLIVCINLANLMLFRTWARQREVAIRLALGASRARIIRQILTESIVLTACAAVGGMALAWAAIHFGARVMPSDVRLVLPAAALRPTDAQTVGLMRLGLGLIGLDASTVGFALITAVAAAILFGLAPACRGSRGDLTIPMKSAAGVAAGPRRDFALRHIVVTVEIALALVVLTAGGLMAKSVANLQATALGFRPEGLLTFRVPLAAPRYDARSASDLLQRLVTALASRPGVKAVALGSCAPVSGGCNRTSMSFPDRAEMSAADNKVEVLWATPGFFDTLGIRVARGRAFDDYDRVGQPKVVLINETAARTYFSGADPIGQRIALGQGGFASGAEIIGIVDDVKYLGVDSSVLPGVYIPYLQSPRSGAVVFVRVHEGTPSLLPAVRTDVAALDPDLPVIGVRMMDERIAEDTWRTRTMAWLLGAFAALALLLAAVGLYGVVSQGVEQRRREIGVRMAIGADRRQIVSLIIGRVLRISVAGIVIGILCAIPAMRVLSSLLYRVRPGDPIVFSLFAMVLLAVALLAGYVPARRAARLDPLTTLRAE